MVGDAHEGRFHQGGLAVGERLGGGHARDVILVGGVKLAPE